MPCICFATRHFSVSFLKVVVERRLKLVGEDRARQRLRLRHRMSQLRANHWFWRVSLCRGRGESCSACVNYRPCVWNTVWSLLLSRHLATWKEKTAVSLRFFLNGKQFSSFVGCWVNFKLKNLCRLAVAVIVLCLFTGRSLVNTSHVGLSWARFARWTYRW